MICMSNCDKQQMIQISDQAWNEVIAIFREKAETDQHELNNIASALVFIEKDIINQLTPKTDQNSNTESNQNIDITFTNKDETFNARKALILFLDNGFIHRHLLRNSQKRTVWLINNESAIALQSEKTGEIYIIDPTSTEFGSPPKVSPYKQWKNEKSMKRIGDEINKLLPIFGTQ